MFIYPGIPFLAGLIKCTTPLHREGHEWYENVFTPKLGPITLVVLVFTIVVMFSLKGEYVIMLPLDVLRVAVPLTAYFFLMQFVTFFLAPPTRSELCAGDCGPLYGRQQRL